jgi:hypothetical protein
VNACKTIASTFIDALLALEQKRGLDKETLDQSTVGEEKHL